MICGLPKPLWTIVRVPETGPVFAGVKETFSVQEAAAARGPAHVFGAIVKTEGEIEILLRVKVLVDVFCKVTFWGPDTLPIRVLPAKINWRGETERSE
jgi:hypothetical protein